MSDHDQQQEAPRPAIAETAPRPVTRVFSGMQPTGELHLGNWLGALRNWVELQDRYTCIFCIVDSHALTQEYDPREMPARIRNVAVDWLAAGIDPERCTVFVQSTVPEHAELAWVFNTIAPMGLLERMTQFKDKAQSQPENINAGLFTYPVLQAADIAIYKADGVPVGEDQVQHIEVTRDIVRKFNNRYGEVFPEPQALLTSAPRVLGTDGERKMSKSLGNHIGLGDSSETIWRKIAPAKTDIRRKRRSDPGVPEDCNIFSWHRFFSSPEEQAWAAEGCRTAGIGCRDCKQVVARNIDQTLAPMRERRAALERAPHRVTEILAAGTGVMRPQGRETMLQVREAMGIPARERYEGA
jgi:tryptophanyl-tRNA synthetase